MTLALLAISFLIIAKHSYDINTHDKYLSQSVLVAKQLHHCFSVCKFMLLSASCYVKLSNVLTMYIDTNWTLVLETNLKWRICIWNKELIVEG